MSNTYISFKVPVNPELEVFYSQAKNEYKGCILCVPGICHGAWCFENFLAFFPDNGYDCYALSFRGHAGSGGHEGLSKYKLSDYLDDVKKCIEYCKSEKCEYKMKSDPFLLGHSMGGAVVQKYMYEYSNKLKGSILFASATAKRMPWLKTIGSLRKKNLRNSALKAWGFKISDEQIAGSAFFDNRIKSPNDIKRYNKLLHRESFVITFVSLYFPYYIRKYSGDIPILVVGSYADSYFPKKSLEKTAKTYKCSKTDKRRQLEILPDLCHDMMLDPEWKKSAKVVLKFMENNK